MLAGVFTFSFLLWHYLLYNTCHSERSAYETAGATVGTGGAKRRTCPAGVCERVAGPHHSLGISPAHLAPSIAVRLPQGKVGPSGVVPDRVLSRMAAGQVPRYAPPMP